MYEKKTYILQIAHLFWMKAQGQGPDVLQFMWQAQKELVMIVSQYILESTAVKSVSHSSQFFTQMITYVDRVIVAMPQEFMGDVVSGYLVSNGFSFDRFVNGWITKMDMIASRESHRINNIARYTLLPRFTAEMLQQHLPEIARYTFQRLEDFLYAKLTQSPSLSFSPSKLAEVPSTFGYLKNGNMLKVRFFEKLS